MWLHYNSGIHFYRREHHFTFVAVPCSADLLKLIAHSLPEQKIDYSGSKKRGRNKKKTGTLGQLLPLYRAAVSNHCFRLAEICQIRPGKEKRAKKTLDMHNNIGSRCRQIENWYLMQLVAKNSVRRKGHGRMRRPPLPAGGAAMASKLCFCWMGGERGGAIWGWTGVGWSVSGFWQRRVAFSGRVDYLTSPKGSVRSCDSVAESGKACCPTGTRYQYTRLDNIIFIKVFLLRKLKM